MGSSKQVTNFCSVTWAAEIAATYFRGYLEVRKQASTAEVQLLQTIFTDLVTNP